MKTKPKSSNSNMEVTSIRLEPELKDKLRSLSGEMGYQSLIRSILWQYVKQHSQVSANEIRASFSAIAHKEETCALTGQSIHPHDDIWLGVTTKGELVPLCREGLDRLEALNQA